MADVAGKGENPESEVPEELLRIIMLLLVLRALQQLQVGLDRNEALVFLLDKARSLAVASLDPDEKIRIKYHDTVLHGDDSSPFRRIASNFAY